MKIAVVGATGLVGRKIINLCEKYFDSDVDYSFFASSKSAGSELEINGNKIIVQELNDDIFFDKIKNYDVKVKDIRTAIKPGKKVMKGGRPIGKRSKQKKAFITLKEGKIEIVQGV